MLTASPALLFWLVQPAHDDREIDSLHVHDCLELGLCHRGHGVFLIGEKLLPFTEGDVVLITQHEAHLARSASGTTTSWTWIWLDVPRLLGTTAPRAAWLDSRIHTGAGFANIPARDSHPGLAVLLREIIRLLPRRPGQKPQAALLWLLAAFVDQFPVAQSPEVPAVPRALTRLGPALDYLSSHFHETPEITALARLCGMSLTNFRREFRRTLGRPVHRYLVELRVQFAGALLKDPRMRIAEAAYSSGFETLSSFHRAFVRHHGCSPREWKRTIPATTLTR